MIFPLRYNYDYIRGRPYDLNKVMVINERHFKMDSSLAPSELVVNIVCSNIGKVE